MNINGKTREATPAERSIFSQFSDLVNQDTARSFKTMLLGDLLKRLEPVARVWKYPGPLWTAQENQELIDFVRQRNFFDAVRYRLETGDLFFRTSQNDLDVYELQKMEKPSLTGFPLILIAAGVLIVSGAIMGYQILKNKRIALETDYKKRLLDLDRWALKQGPDIRTAYERFKTINSDTEEKRSIWAEISKAGSSILWIVIALGALWWISKQPAKNPCSGGS